MNQPKVSCIILAKNEAHRITPVVKSAMSWADEVIVSCKPSTDGTEDLVLSLGAKLNRIPDSAQGMERAEDVMIGATHDWCLFLTAGEIPTPDMARAIHVILAEYGDAMDAIALPFKYWSFGIHDERSPWSWSNQVRLAHKGRAIFTNKVHDSIKTEEGCMGSINASHREKMHFLHQTHANTDDFLRSHVDYMRGEVAAGPVERLQNARNQIEAMNRMAGVPEIHRHAWMLYWNGVAMCCIEAIEGSDVLSEYQIRREEYSHKGE